VGQAVGLVLEQLLKGDKGSEGQQVQQQGRRGVEGQQVQQLYLWCLPRGGNGHAKRRYVHEGTHAADDTTGITAREEGCCRAAGITAREEGEKQKQQFQLRDMP
jgi:hypothetical protein